MPPTQPEDPEAERQRLRAALIDLVAEDDYESLTVARLVRRAGLSHSAFERHFADLEDCFAAVWGDVDAELTNVVSSAYRGGGEWEDRLRKAIRAGLRYLARDPARARLYIEASRVNDELRRRQYDSVARLGIIIDRGRKGVSREQVPVGIAEAVSGAIWMRVAELVRAGQGTELPARVHELMYFAVLPYRGAAAAEAELQLD